MDYETLTGTKSQARVDEEHLSLFATLHYILGGLTVLFSCMFVFHIVMGLTLVHHPSAFTPPPSPPTASYPPGYVQPYPFFPPDVMPKPEHLDELRADLRKRLLQNPPALAAFINLVNEFTPELKLLKPPYGITAAFDLDDVKKSLVALAARPAYPPAGPVRPPFSDVPRDHWAYQSVETLRKLGIVGGYSDGAYQTGRG